MTTDLRLETPVLTPAAALEAGEARVGGKAIGLAKLAAAGVPVPRWVVLPVEAFEHDLGPDLLAVVKEAIGSEGPFAVRSSAVGEDSSTHSFAGIYDSFLHRRDMDEVADAIRRCWASAVSERARDYRSRRGGSTTTPAAMAVIVQEMAEGEVSGVLFTSNPVSGRSDELLVNAAWGLGEGIVSGLCNSDEYMWSPERGEVSAQVADKDVEVVPDEAAAGTREAGVEDSRRRVRCLAPEAVADLCRQGLRVAEYLGAPQDIEWTRRDGHFVFLQSRPITARPEAALGDRRIVWDNSNVQESYNGVTSPLTFSIVLRTYHSVHEQTLRLLRVAEETIAEYQPVLRNMIGLVRGRVYYNIDNWYRVLQLVPAFDRKKEDMEHMMGVEHPVDFVEGTSLTTGEKLRKLPSLLPVGARLVREFARVERSVDRHNRWNTEHIEAVDREGLRHAPLDELIGLGDRIQVELLDRWTAPLINDAYVMTQTGRLRRLVRRAVGEEEAEEVVTGLLSGEQQIESKEPTRRLMEMAQRIRSSPSLMEALDAPDALAALRERSTELTNAVEDYLERYGDRCMGEMKFETISLRQDPSFLVQVLRNYAAVPDLDPDGLDRQERARRERYEQRVMQALGPRRRRKLRKLLANARRGVKSRENMRFVRTRVVGLIRDVYTAVGERLHEAGVLGDPRDVFYLTADELSAYIEGRSVFPDLARLARMRREEFEGYEREDLPNRFETFGSAYHGRLVEPFAEPPGAGDGRVLKGTGCCPGVVEGEVAVVRSPDDDLAINGKVLTALRTDPGWGPLFPSAAALLIERGSTLSHSAVLAREFGIPAVVGIPGLLTTVKDGRRVRLDGGSGVVELLDDPE